MNVVGFGHPDGPNWRTRRDEDCHARCVLPAILASSEGSARARGSTGRCRGHGGRGAGLLSRISWEGISNRTRPASSVTTKAYPFGWSPDRGAPVRHAEGLDGCNPFPDPDLGKGQDRNELAGSGLQHEADDPDLRGRSAAGGRPGLRLASSICHAAPRKRPKSDGSAFSHSLGQEFACRLFGSAPSPGIQPYAARRPLMTQKQTELLHLPPSRRLLLTEARLWPPARTTNDMSFNYASSNRWRFLGSKSRVSSVSAHYSPTLSQH